ncbi:MAG: endonuclease III [Calditrichaeota bacterium]|nr:endonuclease III [Calditrichota bacterium]
MNTEKTDAIVSRLLEKWPEPKTELKFSNPFQLLIATILSAQSTDSRVNMITPAFFKSYPRPKKLAKEKPDVIAEKIKSTGFYRNKAKSIIACCQRLVNDFGGEVPDDIESLAGLPGVGRKTANIVLGNAFGKPGIAVDTHVKRVADRLDLSHAKSSDDVEKELMKIVDEKKWTVFSNLLVLHGRYICQARRPKCEKCAIVDICSCKEKTV